MVLGVWGGGYLFICIYIYIYIWARVQGGQVGTHLLHECAGGPGHPREPYGTPDSILSGKHSYQGSLIPEIRQHVRSRQDISGHSDRVLVHISDAWVLVHIWAEQGF